MAKAENTIRNEIKEVSETSEPKKRKKKAKSSGFSLGFSPRVIKISGLLLISASLFLMLSMVSFLFSWQTDQSMVQNVDWTNLTHVQLTKFKTGWDYLERWLLMFLFFIGLVWLHFYLYQFYSLRDSNGCSRRIIYHFLKFICFLQ